MSKEIIIAVDGMGGENAPLSVIEGLSIFVERNQNMAVFFHVFGNQNRLNHLLESYPNLAEKVQIFHTDEIVHDDEQPVRALKKYPNSSMRLAIDDVKSGRANACISSGNTGALMVIAKMVLGTVEGIKRPAICSVFPNLKSGCVMLDLGANAECDPQILMQFAMMGSCFAKAIYNVKQPLVGILNVGHEEHKGRDIDKKTFELLKQSKLNFHGFVEPYDIYHGTVQVVVTDGFTGNIALKTAEGAVNVCKDILRNVFKRNLLTKFAALLVTKILKQNLAMVDPEKHNGAMFIGLNGIVVKSHGSSSSEAFSNALKKAYDLAVNDVNSQIKGVIEEVRSLESESSLVSRIKHKLGF